MWDKNLGFGLPYPWQVAGHFSYSCCLMQSVFSKTRSKTVEGIFCMSYSNTFTSLQREILYQWRRALFQWHFRKWNSNFLAVSCTSWMSASSESSRTAEERSTVDNTREQSFIILLTLKNLLMVNIIKRFRPKSFSPSWFPVFQHCYLQ